ncbi:hypothetical protein [Streptomyces sp. NPDC031705]|uniref:hypothetical protein n=1 Tax=Streptomyces sp. NPDC031705 TaxID=3155729 RepID=UPI003405435A
MAALRAPRLPAVAPGGVLMILLGYGSLLMPLLAIASSVLGLAAACAVRYAPTRSGRLPLDGQRQGIRPCSSWSSVRAPATPSCRRPDTARKLTGQPDTARVTTVARRLAPPPRTPAP